MKIITFVKSLMFSKYFYPLLFMIVAIMALSMRSVEIFNHNYIFGFDSGRDYLYVKEMIENLKPRLIGVQSGVQGMFHGPLYLYILSIFFLLFKGDPYGGLVMVFLTGIVTLGVFYFVLFKILNKWSALFGLFILAISPGLSFYSRVIWNPHFVPLFVIATYYFTYLIPKNNNIFFPLAVFFATLTYNFEIVVTIPLVISLFIYSLFLLKIHSIKTYVLGLSGFILGIFPFIVFELRHSFNGIKGIVLYLSDSSAGGGLPILSKLKNQLPSYWYAYRDVIPHQNTNMYIIFMISILVFIMFVSVLFLRSRQFTSSQKKLLIFLYIVLIFTILTNAFLIQGALWGHYIPHIGITVLFIFTFVFFYTAKINNLFLRLFLGVIILIFFLLSMLNIISLWKDDYYDYGKEAKIAGKRDAIDYIYKDAGKEPFSVFVFMPPIYTYPYDYLFKRYGEKAYGFVPGNSKEGLFYLLIEPDASQPWTYEGWKETVIKTGEVQWIKTLQSGIIIEKRIGTESAEIK